MWTNPLPTIPTRITRPSWLGLRSVSPELEVEVLDGDGVLVTVAIWFWLFWHVEITTEPSAAGKCVVTQLDQRELVEFADADPSSATNWEPMLYAQLGIVLSGSGMRKPPNRVQQADTAFSLFAQQPW